MRVCWPLVSLVRKLKYFFSCDWKQHSRKPSEIILCYQQKSDSFNSPVTFFCNFSCNISHAKSFFFLLFPRRKKKVKLAGDKLVTHCETKSGISSAKMGCVGDKKLFIIKCHPNFKANLKALKRQHDKYLWSVWQHIRDFIIKHRFPFIQTECQQNKNLFVRLKLWIFHTIGTDDSKRP